MGLGDLIDDDEPDDTEEDSDTGSGDDTGSDSGLAGLVSSAADKEVNTASSNSESSTGSSGSSSNRSGSDYADADTITVEEDFAPPQPSEVTGDSPKRKHLPDMKDCPSCQEPGPKATDQNDEPLWYWRCQNEDCDTVTFLSSVHRGYYKGSDDYPGESNNGKFVDPEDDEDMPDAYKDFLSDFEVDS